MQDSVCKISEDVRKVRVHHCLKMLQSESCVRIFRCMCRKIPAPVIGRQQLQGLIHEDATLLRSGEFAAVPSHPVERLKAINELKWLARADDGRREADGVKRYVVLPHELDVVDILCPLIGTPPSLPPPAGCLRPFLG